MTRSECVKRASSEEIWEAIDVYGNHYEFGNEADAYMFCYNYIERLFVMTMMNFMKLSLNLMKVAKLTTLSAID